MTKKVGPAGRFGPRYGSKIKERLLEVELQQRQKHPCPACLKPGLKRLAKGIWYCPKCGLKFAGKAYKPR
ncbi:MAG: 50S ribosomal protein L37ae [Candidatus Aenigmatarchaeota archaeon]|nr:MAG: 50S ribosomal protein L37ae [Candidatus Aenigmarchaeota archaeon]